MKLKFVASLGASGLWVLLQKWSAGAKPPKYFSISVTEIAETVIKPP